MKWIGKHIVTSDATFIDDINLGDGDKIILGDGSDAEIYVSGDDLYIVNTTDDKDIILQSDDGSGGVTAYLTLDGTNVRTKFHKYLNLEDNVQLQIGNSQDLKLYHKLDTKLTNKRFWIQDISKPWTSTTDSISQYYHPDKVKEYKYQYIISLMSFHNARCHTESKFNNLLTELNSKTIDGSIMVISFLDRDSLFPHLTENHKFPDGSFMSLTNSQDLLYYYSWRHLQPIKEPILSISDITYLLGTHNWIVRETYKAKEINKENPWNLVLNSFTILTFYKNEVK